MPRRWKSKNSAQEIGRILRENDCLVHKLEKVSHSGVIGLGEFPLSNI